MKRFKTYVSVLLAIGLIGCVLLGKVPHAHAATAQNGVMLIFNNNLGSTVSGNFWLNDTGKQMVFTETEDGDKRILHSKSKAYAKVIGSFNFFE